MHIPAHKFAGNPPSGPASVAPPPASWKVEVIADSSGKWCGNGVRYASEAAAKIGGADLANRWFAWRVAPSDEPANYDIVNGNLVAIVKGEV